MKPVLKTKHLDFAELAFSEDYVIARLKEDTIFGQNEVRLVTEACLDFFQKKKFIYISQRVHDYNVNPTVYFNLNEVKFLSGIAIVCHGSPCLNMAKFEKEFSKLPFGIFVDLEEAIEWGQKVLKKKKADL